MCTNPVMEPADDLAPRRISAVRRSIVGARSSGAWGELATGTTVGRGWQTCSAMGVKEVERAELHKTIWRIANDLRGSVDGWDFKTYVLGTLFYRFISENLTAYLNEQERKAGSPDFDYAALSDVEAERGRAGDGRREGLLHPPQRALRERARAGAPRREPQRDAREGLPRHRGLRGRHGERGRHQGALRRPRRQLEQARAHGREAQREARQAARRDRRPRPRATPTTRSTRSATPTST